jgi:hypothetical protein
MVNPIERKTQFDYAAVQVADDGVPIYAPMHLATDPETGLPIDPRAFHPAEDPLLDFNFARNVFVDETADASYTVPAACRYIRLVPIGGSLWIRTDGKATSDASGAAGYVMGPENFPVEEGAVVKFKSASGSVTVNIVPYRSR